MTNKKKSKEIESWSPEQVAIMLHVSTPRIYKAIEEGQLPVQKIGADYAIHRESVEKFLRTGNPFAQRSDVDLIKKSKGKILGRLFDFIANF